MDVMYSSKSDEWETPESLFEELDREFHFTLDPCASHSNHKCEKFFSKQDDGLTKSWQSEVVFCNPPYGRQIGKWVEKAKSESLKDADVVMLIPSRTDTRWFHDHVLHDADEIRFIKGRIKFGGSNKDAPFPSMIVVYRKRGMT